MKKLRLPLIMSIIVVFAVIALAFTSSTADLVAAEEGTPPEPTQKPPEDDQVYWGDPTDPHEYPELVWILKSDMYFSAGILIDSEWVLTTGHAIHLTPGKRSLWPWDEIIVIAGDYDLSLADGEIAVGVEKTIRHDDFWWDDLYDNIGLIKLDTPIPEIPGYIEYAELNFFPDETVGENLMIVGWGEEPPVMRDCKKDLLMQLNTSKKQASVTQ